jgi:hypothetical protein
MVSQNVIAIRQCIKFQLNAKFIFALHSTYLFKEGIKIQKINSEGHYYCYYYYRNFSVYNPASIDNKLSLAWESIIPALDKILFYANACKRIIIHRNMSIKCIVKLRASLVAKCCKNSLQMYNQICRTCTIPTFAPFQPKLKHYHPPEHIVKFNTPNPSDTY